ncbi:hypothetical protein IEQ34_017694 [Dendrobium chrysotoxum]|uniref:Uncharacterized protein n=1 Tax=Dendrobium chrysotoxum TaxID=161865 RepID=A0AAV7GB20_DENCH|nr:hypothetical protein IEQ34_017694 [Dendrobium chrysotoxum]
MAVLHPVEIQNFYIKSASFFQFSRSCRSPFIFFDTKFPGCIFRASKHHRQLSLAKHYFVLKFNADDIRPILVSLTVSDGGTSTATLQFKLRDFDLRCHSHALGSIALLKSSGINLTRNQQLGIPSTWLAHLLLDAGLVGDFSKATCYDFAILFKALFQLTTKTWVRLSKTMEEFMALKKCFWWSHL